MIDHGTMGHGDKDTQLKIYRMIQEQDIVKTNKISELRWVSHVTRMHNNDLAKKTFWQAFRPEQARKANNTILWLYKIRYTNYYPERWRELDTDDWGNSCRRFLVHQTLVEAEGWDVVMTFWWLTSILSIHFYNYSLPVAIYVGRHNSFIV